MKKEFVMVKEPFGHNSEKGERRPARLSQGGVVRVYDPVSGHYTTCHELTESQIRYVKSRCYPTQ